MPFALVIIGLLMIVTGAKDTHLCLGRELQADFSGPPNQNFLWWVAAIGGLGALGAIEPMRGLSKMLMALTVIAMVLAQSKNGGGGFFGQLFAALKAGPDKIDPAQCQPVMAAGATTAAKPVSGVAATANASGTPEGAFVSGIFDKLGLTLPAFIQKGL